MQLKKDVLSLLQKDVPEDIFREIAHLDAQRVLNPLFSALCHPLEKVRWNAVLCFGRVVPTLSEKDMESARIVMRRFLWSLNDESGGIGWGVPEAMAEVMCHSTTLRHEYLHMLISYMREDGDEMFQDGNYLELPMLQRGLLWGVGRLCQYHKEEMLHLQVVDDVAAYLDSEDAHVKAHALWCLEKLGIVLSGVEVESLLGLGQQVRLFIDNKIETYTISQLAHRVVGH